MKIEDIIIDEPIEVNRSQYMEAMAILSGHVAGQERDGKFYIKLWTSRKKQRLLSIVNSK